MKLSPDEWTSWVLLGDPDERWPVTLNELARRIKQAITEDRLMRTDRYIKALEQIRDHYTDTDLAAKHMAAIAKAVLDTTEY